MNTILTPAELLDPFTGEWTPLRANLEKVSLPRLVGSVVEIVEAPGLPKSQENRPTVQRVAVGNSWMADCLSRPPARRS